jgi:hypothetical protein
MALMPGIASAEVMALLDARCANEVRNQDIEAWRERLIGWREVDDAWLVGAGRLSNLPSAAKLSWLLVRDPYDPAARSLGLSIRGQKSAAKEMVLELPEDRICARLLRDPFESITAEPSSLKSASPPRSNLIFDGSGTKLFTRGAGKEIIAFPIPNSPSAGAGKPKHYFSRKGRYMESVGRFGRAIAGITGSDGLIEIEYLRRPGHFPPAGYYACLGEETRFATVSDGKLRPCFSLSVEETQVLAIDGTDSLFRVRAEQQASKVGGKYEVGPARVEGYDVWGAAYRIASEVLAIAPVGSRVAYVGRRLPGKEWSIGSIALDASYAELPFAGAPAGAFFGAGGPLSMGRFGLVAVGQDSQHWWVLSAEGTSAVELPNGWEAIGVSRFSGEKTTRRSPALVALGQDKRTVSLVGKDSWETLFRARSAIKHITVSGTAPYVAYLNVDGEIVVYGIAQRAALCRFTGVDAV